MIKWTDTPAAPQRSETVQTYSLVYEHQGQIKAFTMPTIPTITDTKSREAKLMERMFDYDFPGYDRKWEPNSTD